MVNDRDLSFGGASISLPVAHPTEPICSSKDLHFLTRRFFLSLHLVLPLFLETAEHPRAYQAFRLYVCLGHFAISLGDNYLFT